MVNVNKWEKTDDLQYIRRVTEEVYEVAEARLTEGKYIVCRGEVNIADWMNDSGNYNDDCQKIITTYYSSVKDFEANYEDKNFRKQVLAEMIFEQTFYWDTDIFDLVSANEVEKKLKKYITEYIPRCMIEKYWDKYPIAIECSDGTDFLAQENGYTLEECKSMKYVKFFLDL